MFNVHRRIGIIASILFTMYMAHLRPTTLDVNRNLNLVFVIWLMLFGYLSKAVKQCLLY